MSMTFSLTDAMAQGIQNKVQRLVVKKIDSIVTTSASTATIDVGQNIDVIRSAIHIKDGAASPLTVSAASQVVSGTTVVLSLTAALATADAIAIDFIVSET